MNIEGQREKDTVSERVVVRESVRERTNNTYLNRMINEKREKLERRKRDTEKDREDIFNCDNITRQSAKQREGSKERDRKRERD